jgi:hypothetical protein
VGACKSPAPTDVSVRAKDVREKRIERREKREEKDKR